MLNTDIYPNNKTKKYKDFRELKMEIQRMKIEIKNTERKNGKWKY